MGVSRAGEILLGDSPNQTNANEKHFFDSVIFLRNNVVYLSELQIMCVSYASLTFFYGVEFAYMK